MTEQQQADAVAAWLARGGPPPEDVDPDVIEAILALRPDLAPVPDVPFDDVLGTLRGGPLATPVVEAPAEPTPANRRWRGWMAGVAGVLAAAGVMLVVSREPAPEVLPSAQRIAAEADLPVESAKAETPHGHVDGSGDVAGHAPAAAAPPPASQPRVAETRRRPPPTSAVADAETTAAPRAAFDAAPPPEVRAAEQAAAPVAGDSRGSAAFSEAASGEQVALPPAKLSAPPAAAAAPSPQRVHGSATSVGLFDESTLDDAIARATRLASTDPRAAATALEPWIRAPATDGQRAALVAAGWAERASDPALALRLVEKALALPGPGPATAELEAIRDRLR
jgi:hypothetical protein